MSSPSPFVTGLKGRCPKCGEGPLFDGYLKIAERCGACGQSFENADVGDGASVFIILITGFLIVIPALLLQVAFAPPPWVQVVVWSPVAVLICLGLLRPAKGLLYALQFKFNASEARLDE